jgi:hypothetical protein
MYENFTFTFFTFTPFYIYIFKRFRKNYEKRLLASSCLSVCRFVRSPALPPVRTEQLGFHWTDFHEILHLSIFQKSVDETQFSLKPDKNKG